MDRILEFAEKIHSEYVGEDCAQLMIPYCNYAQIYGNGKLMYYHYLLKNIECNSEETANVDIKKMNRYINEYINDERNVNFPFASLPYHSEKVGLFKRLNYTNQLLDFEKPYVKINDGFITKLTVFKDGEDAIVHTKVLNDKYRNFGELVTSRDVIEKYFKTGTLDGYDDKEYKSCQICDLDGGLYDISLPSEVYYRDLSKREISKQLELYNHDVRVNDVLERMVLSSDEQLLYIVVTMKYMFKFDENGEMSIDSFTVTHFNDNKYKIYISEVPLKKETLENLKERIGNKKVDYTEKPKLHTIKKKILTY